MKEVLLNGGVVFMGILSLVLFTILIILSIFLIQLVVNKENIFKEALLNINRIKSLGLFALVFGLLGQLIGLFSAFRAIKLGEVEATQSLFSEGFRISMIPSIYGISIFALSLLIWLAIKHALRNFV